MFEGRHFQNAYVTRDIKKGIERFKQLGDVRLVLEHEGTTEVMTPKGPISQTNKLAFIWVDDLQYELIQPVSGDVDMYREALPADDKPVFHHICMRVNNWEEFRARVDKQPFPLVMERGGDDLKFLYLDARPFVGHYLEYVWMKDKVWGQMGGR